MPVDPSSLERALSNIRKEYNVETIRTGNSYGNPDRISTGSLELDLVLGGGIPEGRWSHFYGGKNSAKTLTALNVIGNAQKKGRKAALYNVEKQYAAEWAAKHGVDNDDLILVEETKIEDIGAIMEELMGSVHLHVIDSLPAAISVDELAADNDEWRPGISARAWGKVLRRVNERFDERENTIIFINHVGAVFGKYGGSDEPKGAKFVEYLSSLSLDFRRTSWLFRDKKGFLREEGSSEASLSGDKTPAGIEYAARVQKSRVCKPFRTARMRLDFDSGQIDDLWSISKAAILYGLVDKPNPKQGWMNLPDGSKLNGEPQLREYIAEHPEFKEEILKKLKDELS